MFKEYSNHSALKSGAWFTISNFLIKAIGFITTPIFTRLLTKAEYGDFSNFLTWAGIVYIITSLNLEASLVRGKFDFKDDFSNYLFSITSLAEISTAIWFFVFQVFKSEIASAFSVNEIYINCMFVYLFFEPIINIYINAKRLIFQYKQVAVISFALSTISSALAVVLVITMDNKLLGRTMGYIIPYALIGTVLFINNISCKSKLVLSYWKYALIITLPYIPHLLSMFLLWNMDKAMIKRICGAEDLALYSLAYTVGSLITILANSVNSAYSPWLGEKLNSKEYEQIRRISVPYVGIAAVFTICVALITPEILYILGGSAYLEAERVLPLVAASCLVQFVYCMYVNVEQFEKKTIGMAIASALAAFINFVTNYLFIPKYGYLAAACTTLASYICLLLMHMLLVKIIDRSHVYRNVPIISITLIASVAIIFIVFIINNLIIRYVIFTILLIIVLFVGFYKRKTVRDFLIKRK